jgi:aminoglycoside phosphotransferase (APT) family kinase protein
LRTESTPSPLIGADPEAVAGWLDRLEVPFVRPLRFDRIGLGQSNLTFLVRDRNDRRWVLRRPPLGELLASAHDVVREARILHALGPTDVPVPRIFGAAPAGTVGEAPFVLMEFVDGVVVDRESVMHDLSPQLRRDIALSMIHTLGRIHAVDLDETGLTTLASHQPYAQRQLKRWTRQWRESWTGDSTEFDTLTTRLAAAVPPQQEVRLVHGDFHLRNVITARSDGTVVAALDWELSTLGDPLADIGSTLAYWPQPGEPGLLGLPALPGLPDRTEIADAYLQATHRDSAALQFWYVLGLWKIGVICAGIMRRATDEPHNRTDIHPPAEEDVRHLLRTAQQAADDIGL